jgi:hypothetical protein
LLSPELLDRFDLALDWISQFLVRRHAEFDLSAPFPMTAESVDRIHLVRREPENATALASVQPIYFEDRSLYFVADHELRAIEGLEYLAEVLPSCRAPVEVAPELRPSALRACGVELAEAWLTADESPLHIALAARPISFSLLSPYPQDLGATLYALARQSPEHRPHEGWSAVLGGPPRREFAALLAEHLTSRRSDLREERRVAERSVGLDLIETPLLTHGRFTARKGSRADPTLRALSGVGAVHLVASRSVALLDEISRVCFASGRVQSLSLTFETEAAPNGVFTARVFHTEDDALEHPGYASLQSVAAVIDQSVDSTDRWGGASLDAELPIRLLRRHRYSELMGLGGAEAQLCLVGHGAWDLCRDDPQAASAPLHAFRIALGAQLHR